MLQNSEWGPWGAGTGLQMGAGLASSICPSPGSQPTSQAHLEVEAREEVEFGDRGPRSWGSFLLAPSSHRPEAKGLLLMCLPHVPGGLKPQHITGAWASSQVDNTGQVSEPKWASVSVPAILTP